MLFSKIAMSFIKLAEILLFNVSITTVFKIILLLKN